MNTNSSIKKESKVDRSRKRLQIAVERLDLLLQKRATNISATNAEDPDLREQYDNLRKTNLFLTQESKKIADRMGATIRRLEEVLGED